MALKNEMIAVLGIISGGFLLVICILSCILLQYSVFSATLLIIFSILCLMRYLALSVLFPGSNKFLKRVFECAFSQDLSIELTQNLSILSNFLISLEKSHFSIEHKRFRQLYYSIKQNLKIFSQLSLSQKQEIFKQTLKSLKNLLKNLKFSNPSQKISLWKVLKNPAQLKKNFKFGVKGDISQCIELCQQSQMLLRTDEKISLFRIFWYDGVILGDLEQKRVDFFSRFDVERQFIQVDSERIDTVLISFSPENEKIVVYCSPNAGFYEYLYYQSDWLEFYKDLEINVFLFNYRGYSLSTGRTSLLNIAKDCCFFVKYLRETKKYEKIIVHGESLGGSVATLVANNCDIDLLIADRTFSSTKCVFGEYVKSQLLGTILTCLGPGNFDIVSNFLSAKCAKILTCDPNDHIIPIKASLLSGVSMKSNSSLSKNSIKKFENSLKALNKYNKQTSGNWQNSRLMFDVNIESLQYVYLPKDEEEFILKNLIFKFFVTSSYIDAAGLQLNELLDHSPELGQMWLRNLEVWGSQPYVTIQVDAEPKHFSVLKLRNFIKKTNKLIAEFSSKNKKIQKIVSEILVIRNTLAQLLSCMEIQFLNEKNYGKMLALTCGHSGVYNDVEKFLMKKFIFKAFEV